MSTGAICGVYHRGGGKADAHALEAMLAASLGQGGTERIGLDAVVFGYRSLWADAAEGGAGQAQCATGKLSIVADVRLDNREELGDAFGLARPERAGIADWELILGAYARWGADCPFHLQGDYAFAIWDCGERLLFCARDSVGARPLYYSLEPEGRFPFASDVAAVLAAPGVEDRLDDAHVVSSLWDGMPSAGSTFFRAVRSLPPGHSLSVSADAEQLRRWWRPEDAPPVRCGSDDDYAQEFLDRYRRSVRDRLRDAHPVGAHLSGGLDSSSVAVLAARELRSAGQPLHVFCWHPPPGDSIAEDEAAEYSLIESVCAQEDLQPRYHSMSAAHVLDLLRRDGARIPSHDGTLRHEALVQRSAAELGVRVILSGWGGDEVASSNGLGFYTELLRRGSLRQLLREARAQTDRPLRFAVRKAILPLVHPGAAEAVARLLRGEIPRRRKSFVHPALARGHRRPALRRTGWGTGVRRSQLAILEYGHVAQRIEDWAASGARAGVEYRYPLLDRRLLEFVLGLPAEQFRRGARSRWIMRQALRSVLPTNVLEHTDKRDPARSRPSQAAMNEALPAIMKQLAARYDPPTRASYLDMPCLLAYLQERVRNSHAGPARLFLTLSFLDWDAD